MNKFALGVIASTLSLAPYAVAFAADDPIDVSAVVILGNDDTPINPVRLPQSARVSSQSLTSEDIERLQPKDVFDLLNYGTGVFTTTTGKKAPNNLNIRGDGNYAFVIDGAYMPAFLASRVLQSIPVTAIEEVRIVRTSTALTISPLVGLVAPSGAANNGFIVVRTSTPRTTSMLARGFVGSNASYAASLQGGTTFEVGGGQGYVFGMAAYSTTDGASGYNQDRTSTSALLKAGYSDDRLSADVSILKDAAEFGFQRSTTRLQTSTYTAKWRMDPLDTYVVSGNATFRWNQLNTTLLTAAYTESTSDFVQQTFVDSSRVVLPNDNKVFNAALRHNLFLGDTRLQAGVDYIRWHTPTGQFYYEGIEREEAVRGAFLQGDLPLFDSRLNIDLGARVDRVKIIKGIDYYAPGRQPNNPTKISDRTLPTAKFFSAGASFRVAGDWLVNARYGYSSQGARSGVTPFPAVTLEGETRQKFEVGFEGSLTPWLEPSLNYFQVETENEAAPRDYIVVGGVQIARYDNTDSKRAGIEAVLSGSWGSGETTGRYRASVTHFLDVLDPSGLLARTQPDTVAELTLDQTMGNWRASVSGKYVARYDSNSFARCPTPTGVCPPGVAAPFLPIGDYSRVDLSISRRFEIRGAALRVTASVKNLTDEKFETTLGYPDAGRIYGLELVSAF